VALHNAYASYLADQTMREVVVHQLQPKDQVLDEAMGLQSERIAVSE
jgi:hypothetical protein